MATSPSGLARTILAGLREKPLFFWACKNVVPALSPGRHFCQEMPFQNYLVAPLPHGARSLGYAVRIPVSVVEGLERLIHYMLYRIPARMLWGMGALNGQGSALTFGAFMYICAVCMYIYKPTIATRPSGGQGTQQLENARFSK